MLSGSISRGVAFLEHKRCECKDELVWSDYWVIIMQLIYHILFQTARMVGIFIGNLAKGGVAVVTESDLKPLFELYGTVEKVQIKTKGFCVGRSTFNNHPSRSIIPPSGLFTCLMLQVLIKQ